MSTLSSLGAGFAASCAVVLSAAAPVSAAPADEPGPSIGGKVSQAGWWWKSNDENEVDKSGLVARPEPTSPNVPAGAMTVAAVNGAEEMVAAIEFALKYGPGADVTSFDVVLRESSAPDSNVNSDGKGVKVVACPVTDAFWTKAEGGKWSSRPAYDCERAAVAGKRGKDGLWHFDLTSIARLWLAEDSQLPTSIALVEQVEAPMSFQVTWDGPSDKGIGMKLVATGGATSQPPADTPAGSGTTGDSGAVDTGAGTDFSGEAPADAGTMPDAAPAPDAQAPAATEAQDVARSSGPRSPVAATPVTHVGSMLEDIPGGVLFLIPVGLGLAYAVMFALGPNGEPVLSGARHGVGRALDQLRAIKTYFKEAQ
ncbi:hypothetical protein [Streptomyces sp. 8N616]|uniref:hypothetical protein n=1 Tax=Streptomyces sp. 8N616 TaxID=3457414 RepID=UPI003FD30DF4